MCKCAPYIVTLCFSLIITLSSFQAEAELYEHVETFSTTQYCDKVNTTAWWDTLAGEIKLHPFTISPVGYHETPGYAMFVVVRGDYAYVADYSSGLQVLDVSDPTAPTPVGSCDTPGASFGVAVAGNYAYVGDLDGGLQVIDISDPTSPAYAGSCGVSGSAIRLAVAGSYAYVAVEWLGLKVVDISDPTSPFVAGTCATPSSAAGVAVSGCYAYVADPNSGLHVVDISDPTSPSIVGSFDTPGFPIDVTVDGTYAYVADHMGGVQIVDISDPTNPVSAGSFAASEDAMHVAVCGSHAYVVNLNADVQVLDVSDPANPVLVGSWDPMWFGELEAIAVVGEYAYMVAQFAGLWVLDVSDPTAPTPVGSCDTPGYSMHIAVSGDHAYIADYTSGLQVVQVYQRAYDTERNEAQSTVITNPVALITSVKLTTDQTGSIEWQISADGGDNWQVIPTDDDWHTVTHAGTDLLWKSVLGYAGGNIAPTCSNLQINWEGTVATMLQSSSASYRESAIEITWILSEVDDHTEFLISRAVIPGEQYEELSRVNIARTGMKYTTVDKDIEPGTTYRYRVEFTDGTGRGMLFETDDISTPYLDFTLYQNHPNPFNPSTEIQYYVPERCHVVLDIYDVSGSRIARLVDCEQAKGLRTVRWDGTGTNGNSVGSGVYFSVLTAGKVRLANKMVLLR